MTVYVGNQVQAEFGIWAWNGTPNQLAYQWQHATNVGFTTGVGNISGETNSDIIAPVGEVGKWLRCTVTATNPGGSSTATNSEIVGPVTAIIPVPVISVAPVASGPAIVGATVTTTNGTWTNSPTSYTYQWQDSANGSTGWANISAATDANYVVDIAEADLYLRCRVTAVNGGGSSTASSSNVLGPVNTGVFVLVFDQPRPRLATFDQPEPALT